MIKINIFFLKALDPITKMKTNKEVAIGDMYTEFNDYLTHDFKCKKVNKHFAFSVPGVKVPQTCDYLQVYIYFFTGEYFNKRDEFI